MQCDKSDVEAFWQQQCCGEVYAAGDTFPEQLDAHFRLRYELEPFIDDFAEFSKGKGKDVLEIGVGMGADHLRWAESHPLSLTGVDLTERAVSFTRQRLQYKNKVSKLMQADAENLPFEDDSFDIVYSWGVLHHTPNTQAAINEVFRVLRPGGTAKIMIYHTHAVIGYVLWLRYGLLAGRPQRSLADIYSAHLESPGTKAYSIVEAKQLFQQFRTVQPSTALSVGDLMEGAAGQKHQGRLLAIAKRVWPRWAIRRMFANNGLFLMVHATKQATQSRLAA